MAVAATGTINMQPLNADMQKEYGCYGYFTETVTVAGDASGGAATIDLTEPDDKAVNYRKIWVKALNLYQAVNAASEQTYVLVRGKTNPQFDQLLFWTQNEVAVSGIGPLRAFDSNMNLVLAAHGWFCPVRGPGTVAVNRFEIEVGADNPGAGESIVLEVFGLWDYIKPWR